MLPRLFLSQTTRPHKWFVKGLSRKAKPNWFRKRKAAKKCQAATCRKGSLTVVATTARGPVGSFGQYGRSAALAKRLDAPIGKRGRRRHLSLRFRYSCTDHDEIAAENGRHIVGPVGLEVLKGYVLNTAKCPLCNVDTHRSPCSKEQGTNCKCRAELKTERIG
jgi:hypothetical protein